MSAAAGLGETPHEYRCPCGVDRVRASERELVTQRALWEGVRCRRCGLPALVFVRVEGARDRAEVN